MKTFPQTVTLLLALHIAFNANGQQEVITNATNHEISTCTVNPAIIAGPATETYSSIALSQQVSEFFSSLFDTGSWPARWQCGLWSPFHGWLYIISDFAIGVSYFLIPVILLYFLHKHKHRGAFSFIVTLFIVFILACGLTHFIDASIFWWPAYRLSALIRFVTATVSMGTVFALIKIAPDILQLKSPEMLEKMVQERTTELTKLTHRLQQEIEQRERMERDLFKNEKQYRSLFESAAAGHVVVDESGTIMMINARMEQMFGYEKNALTGQKVEVLIPDAIREKHLGHRITYAQHPKPRHMGTGLDLFGKRKDGTTFPLEISLNHYESEEGIRITALAIDITERKNAEIKLVESEKYYRSLIENISDAIVVNDENYNLIYQSPSVARISGYTEAERKGKSIKSYIHPDHLADFENTYKILIKTPNQPVPFLYRFLHKNGNYIWIEGVVTNLLQEDSMKAIVANYRDVSERKKWEEEIYDSNKKAKANEQQMSAILNALPASIALLDEKGAIKEVNKNWKDFTIVNGFFGSQYGLNANYIEIIRNSMAADQKDAKRIASGIEEVLTRKKSRFTADYPCHSPDERRWFKMIVTPLNQNGLGVVVTHLNITEQRESERQLRLIYEALENSLNAFEIVNQAGEHIYVNRAYLNMYGYDSINEVSGTAPSSRTLDPTLPQKIMNLLQQQKHIKMELTAKRKDGTTFEALMTGILSADEDGLPIFITSAIDITDRKKYEEKVKEERTLLRTLIDNLPDYIYVKDLQSRHLINNKANVHLMGGSSEEETLGKSVADIFEPEIANSYLKDDQMVFKTGLPVVDREETTRTPSGELKYLLTTKVPIRNKDGGVIGLVGISRDITKHKQIEIALRNSNHFLEMAQQVGKFGHWISEIPSKKLIWSAETCNIFDVKPEEFDQREETFFQFVHPEDIEKVRIATSEAIQRHTEYSVDHRIITRSGQIKWVHEQGEANYAPDGTLSYLLGIVHDITNRKIREEESLNQNAMLEQRVLLRTEQLQSANREMEAFTYSVSHDLRAPLRIIDGYAQILIEDYNPNLDKEGQKIVNVIMSNAKKMGHLIDDLLNFSRIGRVEIRKIPVNMNEVVKDVIHELQLGGLVVPSDLTIHGMKRVDCDPNLIKHVWMNLLSNAIKYTSLKEAPSIEVGMIEEDKQLIFFVKDNGAGFDMKYYDKLFGVFQRLHGHDEFQGTGVGLAIVQRIIARHQGSVWAEAKVNGGATFYFALKRKQD